MFPNNRKSQRLPTLVLPVLLATLLFHVTRSAASDTGLNPHWLADKTQRYVDRSGGFSIDLSRDFRLTGEQGDLLFFQSFERRGTLIIRPVPGLTLGNIQQVLRNGFKIESIALKTTGSPVTLNLGGGQGLGMEVQGTVDGREVHGVLAGILAGNNQGYMILIGSVKESWLGFKPAALAMLKSFSVQAAQPGYEHERWEERLEDTRLIFYASRGTYRQGDAVGGEYHFCGNGRYFHRVESASSDSFGAYGSSYSTGSRDKGEWHVEIIRGEPRVILLDKKGRQRDQLAIAERDGKLLLNGMPYRYAANQLCK